jgi:hypothetical protein
MSRLVIFSLGQYPLLRFVNFNSFPLTFLTCVSSVGFSRVFLDVFVEGIMILFTEGAFEMLFVLVGFSLTTSAAFLSMRIPSNEGCRITPSDVISVKLTSHTSFGLSHVATA